MTNSTIPYLLAILSGCLLLVACQAEGSPGSATDDNGDDADDSTAVTGYELSPRDLSRTVRASGTVEPLERIRLKSHISGILTTLDVEVGDAVHQGDLLAQSELSELRAERRRAQALVDKLQRQYERQQPLVARQAVPQSELDDLQSDIDIAESEVQLWQTRIDLSRIHAPKDAVVTHRYVDPGSHVDAHEPIIDLADLSTLVLPIRLSERDVVHLDRQETAAVTLDAHPEHSLTASIRRIFPTADDDSRRITVELVLDDVPEDLEIRPGFLARASLDIDRRRDVLAIPSESLLASTPDDRFVFTIEDDHTVRRSVSTGVERRNLTVITDGLHPGDIIVGAHPGNLREDTRVHVSEWVEAQ